MSIDDDVVSGYWNWSHSLTPNDHLPESNSLINNSDPTVAFLVEPAHMPANASATVTLDCTIRSDQRLLIPVWAAWCDSSEASSGSLLDEAKKRYNLGHIVSEVRVDDSLYANLDVIVCKKGNNVTVTYASKGQQNVTEHSTANEFDLTIPSGSYKATNQGGSMGIVNIGRHKAASHGWWVVVPALSRGQHKVSYHTRVTTNDLPQGCETSGGSPPFTSADITYNLQVQ